MTTLTPTRPNIVLILADDMGFSDIGSYGGEIQTPNLDRLANNGLRFTQMYNSARCCPTRASLLTGLNPQQAGIGHMVSDLGKPAYQGYLNDNCVTIAEVLGSSGYHTFMSGKWHVGGQHTAYDPDSWQADDSGFPTPRSRGFEKFFGTLTGAGSYYFPPTLRRDDEWIRVEPGEEFFYTDAISDNAVEMMESALSVGEPFFQYVAYTAPHWPLHALEEDIAKYEGVYNSGWDNLRMERHEIQRAMGIVDPRWNISPRASEARPWDEMPNKEWEALRMMVYAAMIDRMDQGVGRIVAKLEQYGQLDNTVIMFLSDNGGCAEFLREEPGDPAERFRYGGQTPDGRPIRVGNSPEIVPGPDDTFMSYDIPWANVSCTPFRLYKHWTHEGGIATPFITHWPDRIEQASLVHRPSHLIDIMATCVDIAGATYPTEFNGNPIKPVEGESLLPLIDKPGTARQSPIYWEHEGNRAIRHGDWKLVSEAPSGWELYNMAEDRTELNNLADIDPQRVAAMAGEWDSWASRCEVDVVLVRSSAKFPGPHDHSPGYRTPL